MIGRCERFVFWAADPVFRVYWRTKTRRWEAK